MTITVLGIFPCLVPGVFQLATQVSLAVRSSS
jgi:hypothetical protein